mmetsp:Transcript_12011/g.32172  ORF Transcript_12011/g.32172 Transcript_12011/m.32172 type:complete len:230 (-) Transcript_12011:296-985(-)
MFLLPHVHVVHLGLLKEYPFRAVRLNAEEVREARAFAFGGLGAGAHEVLELGVFELSHEAHTFSLLSVLVARESQLGGPAFRKGRCAPKSQGQAAALELGRGEWSEVEDNVVFGLRRYVVGIVLAAARKIRGEADGSEGVRQRGDLEAVQGLPPLVEQRRVLPRSGLLSSPLVRGDCLLGLPDVRLDILEVLSGLTDLNNPADLPLRHDQLASIVGRWLQRQVLMPRVL